MNQKLKRSLYLIAISVLFVAMPACDDNGVLPIFQPSYDLQLGESLSLQIAADNATYPLLNNATANKYLQDIVDSIIKAPEMLYAKTFKYEVFIINSNVINAFAAPGGYIYVYTGLIKYLESEAEMAAILAHEIAHADKRHAVQRIQKEYGVSFLIDLLMPNNAGALANFAVELLTTAAFMKNSRNDEFEADEYSFKYLKSTNIWYPAAGKDFFQRMYNQSQGNPSIFETLFSTHPTDADRINRLDNLIKSNNIPVATEANLFTARYAEFKARF